jgi:hypothetical protein
MVRARESNMIDTIKNTPLVFQAKQLSDQPIGVLEPTQGATVRTGGAAPAKH